MKDESQPEPKLIIDEDWKSQVEREKEELKRKEEQEKSSSADGDHTDAAAASTSPESDQPGGETQSAASPTEEQQPGQAEEYPPPPPASFSFLLTSLATQAMVALGQMPGEDGQPMPVNLAYARHFIDLMGVLEEKTKGNLEAEEQQLLQETLHQMRMMFVAVSQQQSNKEN